jgi:DNA-binding NarL/FixJ family response regulator
MLNAVGLASARGRGQARAIMLVDERPLMLECTTNVLSAGLEDLHITGCQGIESARAALLSAGRPDLIILGIGLARAADLRVRDDVRRLAAVAPGVAMMLLSDLDDNSVPGEARDALRLGARGYIRSSTPLEVMIAAMRLVLAGGTFIPASALGHSSLDNLNGHSVLLTLTPRETDILARLREGKPNKIIARELSLSVGTVQVHVRRILQKLHATSRSQVAYIVSRLQPEAAVAGAPVGNADCS